jgi:hypothetical protein
MRASRTAIVVVCGAVCVVGHSATSRATQLNHVPPARAPCSVLSGRPCHPSFCSVFQHGPCFPEYLPPIGQDLRLTIVSTDENDPANKKSGNTDKNPDAKEGGEQPIENNEDAKNTPDDHTLETIRDMFAALRECWVPPPKDEARHGMEYTIRFAFKRDGAVIAPPRMTYVSHDAPAEVRTIYRDAIDAALKRCTPLHFSEGMGGAVAGRPIAIRFVDDRAVDNTNNRQ